MSRLLIKNIGILQTPVGAVPRCGEKQGKNVKLQKAAILIEDGIINDITFGGKMPKGLEIITDTRGAESLADGSPIINAGGRLVTPGLIDSHTHAVFGGDLQSTSGGKLDTVRATRETSFFDLYDKSVEYLDEMLRLGVTTCEVKSGYGLDIKNEGKQLKVIKKLSEDHPIDIIPTFMGAHDVPEEWNGDADRYIDELVNDIIPRIDEYGLAEYADAFCDNNVFNTDQIRRYFRCAKEHGFKLKLHADQKADVGGAKLAAEMGAVSAEHLVMTGDEGLEAMKKSGTIAVLLPAASFSKGEIYARARTMIDMGIPVAIATNFNPNSCPSLNLQFAMTLGYLKYGMTPDELLTATTINAACAVGRGSTIGSIEVGKKADIVVWDVPDMTMLCHRFGTNMAYVTIKNGEIMYTKESSSRRPLRQTL